MYHRFRFIILGFLISFLTIILLYYFSKNDSTIQGGFTRNYLSRALIKKTIYHFSYSNFYLAGVTTNTVYLGHTKRPDGLLALDINRGDTTYHPIVTTAIPIDSHILIDSPNFYIQQQRLSTILSGKFHSTAIDTLLYGVFFVDAVVAGQGTLVFRTLTSNTDEFVLASLKDSIVLYPSLLEKQIDGKFCTDGLLRVNPTRDRILYTYYYRNEFICLDTAMNLHYRGNTIDTISRAQITIASIPSSQSITLSSPPRIINKNLQVGANHFYIHSKVIADNEVKENQRSYSSIDVYHLRDGMYAFSFRLPHLSGNSLKDFRIHGKQLIVAYPHSIVVYELPTVNNKEF